MRGIYKCGLCDNKTIIFIWSTSRNVPLEIKEKLSNGDKYLLLEGRPICAKCWKEIKDEETKEMKPKLKLVGTDGNAFSILGAARRVANQNGLNWDEISKEAMSGDYDHLLQTMHKYFEVS